MAWCTRARTSKTCRYRLHVCHAGLTLLCSPYEYYNCRWYCLTKLCSHGSFLRNRKTFWDGFQSQYWHLDAVAFNWCCCFVSNARCKFIEHSSMPLATQSSRGVSFTMKGSKHYRCFHAWNVRRANDWSGIALPTILSISLTAYNQ
jgi:hypothetical protein